MKNNISAKEIKENISLVTLLSKLGYEPAKPSGNELLFVSMLRESDTDPSFSVNDRIGAWFDHGLGKGGNIIDFALLFWPNTGFQDVLEKIIDTANTTIIPEYKRKRLAIKIPNYAILEIKGLGNNNLITNYLDNRGVWNAAQGKLKEVYYYIEDQQKRRKNFFAAGWQNELGAWEVRSLNFKGCLGHKAISFITGNPKRLGVFEGYIDYLSWLTDNPFDNSSILVLNSVSLLQAGIAKAKSYKDIGLYFDNDSSGKQATIEFKKAIPAAIDHAHEYHAYNDYNDKLLATQSALYMGR